MVKACLVALGLAVFASTGAAQTLNEDSAKGALYSSKGADLAIGSSLSASDKSTLRALYPLMQERLAAPVGYFGAFAYSPSEGLVSESLQGAFNFHTVAAAEAAAVRACETAKAGGSSTCRIAARILPKGFRPGGFTMSQQATEGFNKIYDRARGPKAFAISATTGAWGQGQGAALAVADCAKDGAKDCRVVIQD